ncbi:MAG: starch-binding protein, partial [Dysgonamonadaceae bacterium]|nr:starch-binding protein [Dysgonamonadaceae bacterium]
MKMLRFTLLKVFVLLVMGLCAQSISAITVKVKLGSGVNWSSVYIYNYVNGADAECGGWPGKQLIADSKGVYSYTFTGEVGGVIFNNGAGGEGNQYDAPEITGDVCLEITTGGVVVSSGCDGGTVAGVTIRWKQVPATWTSFGIYAWGGSPTGETFGAWPGYVATPDANGWCTVTVPAGQTVGNVIFNNGLDGSDPNKQQFDADVVKT